MEEITMQRLKKTLFTTSKPDEKSHRGVVVFNPNVAITTRQGVHSLLKKGDKLVLYNVVDPNVEIEVVVTAVVDEFFDIVLFAPVTGSFPHYPHTIHYFGVDERYHQLEVGPNREAIWKEGVVSRVYRGHYFGTLDGNEHSNPGCGIYNFSGNIKGFSIVNKRIDFSKLNIGEGADYHPESKFLCSSIICGYAPGGSVGERYGYDSD